MTNKPNTYGHKWRQIRTEVLTRDGNTCSYCGGQATTVDHVIPVARGGDNNPDNLVAACTSCNSAKQDRSASDFLTTSSPPHAPSPLSPRGAIMRRIEPQGAFSGVIKRD